MKDRKDRQKLKKSKTKSKIKLKKSSPINLNSLQDSSLSGPKKLKKKIKPIYKKSKCIFIYPEGHKRFGKSCKRNAVGKSTLCQKHGGKKYDKSLMLPTAIDNISICKYKPETHCLQIIMLAKEGKSLSEIAAIFEVSEKTLKRWAEKYQDFYEAFEVAKTLHEAWWTKKGRSNLNNVRFQTPLFKFMAGNLLGWSEKQESTTRNMNLHGVLMVPGSMTPEEWEKMAAEEAETVGGEN